MDILSMLSFSLAVITGLLILVFLVVVHELGHAIVARRNGVVVEEFGIGFPPRAYARRLKNGVLFTLNWLPLGGFVKLKGEHDSDDQAGGYGSASLWAKTKILLAGVVVNWLTAAVLFTILAIIGLPKVVPGQIGGEGLTQPVIITRVVPDSPAAQLGLKAGDRIISFADENLELVSQLPMLTQKNAGKTVPVTYERGGQKQTKSVTLNSSGGKQGYFGVSPKPQEPLTIKTALTAPVVGIGTTVQFTQLTLEGLGDLLANLAQGITSKLSGNEQVKESGAEALNQAGQGVAGPIGILGNIFPSAIAAGIIPLLFLTAVISLTLAVMNVLPIPALDGGRLYVTLIFRILKRPLTREREEAIQAVGFFALMGLIILVTVLDIGKLF